MSRARVRASHDVGSRRVITGTSPMVKLTVDFDFGDHQAAFDQLEQAYNDVVAQIRSTREDTP